MRWGSDRQEEEEEEDLQATKQTRQSCPGSPTQVGHLTMTSMHLFDLYMYSM